MLRVSGVMWKTCALWLTAATGLMAGNLADLPHPRLWFPKSDVARVQTLVKNDPLAAELHKATLEKAKAALKERTCRYEIPDGKRLLFESRKALKTIMNCGWAWRTTGDEVFRQRVIDELNAACALKDWNPKHFLDVGEMATAVATGYDWLYPTLTPEQRSMCEKAIVEKALKPAKGVFDKGGWWAKPGNNWSQVCGGGIALAAAAIAGHDEGLSEELFTRGLKLVEACSKFYQPDGMYPEGPAYWHYGTNFHILMLAACGPLQRSCDAAPIMEKAGDSIMHLTSTTRMNYNFADGGVAKESPSPAQCWLAGHFKNTTQIRHVRSLFARALAEDRRRVQNDRYDPLAILWLPGEVKTGSAPPNGAVFHGEQAMALFRSGWQPDDSWFGIKGGTAAASHGHMDVGSFVYDAHGERWIHDLGSENYNLPDYFGGKRWTYYRLQNRSHSTLEIGGQLQNAKAKPCPLVSSSVSGNPLTAEFDLTDAYTGSAGKVIRSARFDTKTGAVRLKDEIDTPAGDIVWRAITDAEVKIEGETVTLAKNGKSISLKRVSPDGNWSVADAKPPTAEENQNKGFRKLELTVPKAEKVGIEVEIVP